jgi:hypothetical protein
MTNDLTVRTGQLVDPVLTNLSRQYRPEGFIADLVCPRVTVSKESGKYTVYEKRDFFQTDVNALKPDRSPTKRIDLKATTEPFTCEEYALAADISRREIDNTDDILRLRENKANLVQDAMALAREVRVALLFSDADDGGGINASNESTPTNNWNVDAAEIETDVVTAVEGVEDDTGMSPNSIIIPKKVARAIAKQADIREILKYTVDGRIILDEGEGILPARLWGLRVIVPGAYKTTAREGASTVSLETVWGDDVRVLYLDPTPALERPSFAYTLQTRDVETRRWTEDDPSLEVIEQSEVVVEKAVAPQAAWIIKDVLS